MKEGFPPKQLVGACYVLWRPRRAFIAFGQRHQGEKQAVFPRQNRPCRMAPDRGWGPRPRCASGSGLPYPPVEVQVTYPCLPLAVKR